MIEGDRIRARLFGTRTADFRVISTVPNGPVVINPTTVLEVGKTQGVKEELAKPLSYEEMAA